MSLDLDLLLSKPVNVSHLLTRGRETLRRCLKVEDVPELTTRVMNRGHVTTLQPERIYRPDFMLLVGLDGFPETVGVFVYDMGKYDPSLRAAGKGLRVSIDVSAMRSPLEFVLAACVAIAMGELLDEPVCDPALAWSPAMEQSSERLLEKLANAQESGDLRSAAMTVYRKLPLSKARNEPQ